MENTKKVKSINKKDQIVKLNKKKIIIIFLIIIILVASLGVGLYFAFRPDKTPLPGGAANWVSVNEAKNKVEETSDGTEENPEIVGVYFGIENSDISKLALYGNEYSDEEQWDDLSGPFSEYLESGNAEISWYCINSSNETDNQKNIENFFYNNNSSDEERGIYDNAINEGWSNAWFGGEADNNSINFNANGKDYWNEVDISFEQESDDDSLDDDNDYTLTFKGIGQPITIDYTMPTWMWFRNGELYAMVNGMAHNEDEETGEITIADGSVGESKINEEYWFDMEEIVLNEEINKKP
ncbi:MAG: hypothetical protein HPAVJP_4520 [Candidatus Hepatoplasma vulgare]|nr:MAG: hypothetical protein HPAVJP_4520 [Candidatus Hepatoplasma sp.]